MVPGRSPFAARPDRPIGNPGTMLSQADGDALQSG